MPDQVSFSDPLRHRTVRRFGHHDIGLDALGLDGTTARRVVACRRQLDRRAVVEWQDGLHRALAEGLGTHYHRTLVILEGTGDDFRCRRRAAIDQHHHRHILDPFGQVPQDVGTRAAQIVIRRGEVAALGIVRSPIGGHDQFVRRQERCRNPDRAMQQATWIVAQIQNQTLERSFLVELLEMLDEITRRALLELDHSHIAVARLDHLGLDALHLDDFAIQNHDQGLALALARDRERYLGIGFATHSLDCIAQTQAFDRGVIELDDQVTRLDPGTKRGRILDRRDHLDEAVLHADFDPETAELPLRPDLQFLEGVGVEVGGVRIQSGQHATDRAGDQFLVLHRFYIALLDRVEHIGECAQLLDRQGHRRRLVGVGREIKADENTGTQSCEYQTSLLQLATHERSVGVAARFESAGILATTSAAPISADRPVGLDVEFQSINPIHHCFRRSPHWRLHLRRRHVARWIALTAHCSRKWKDIHPRDQG